jgi:hypothetical protein
MDAYHKVLIKLYEVTKGKETEDVDFAELLKREGFFPSIDSITKHLSGESWITEQSRENIVRITHWGVMEAKRAQANTPGSADAAARYANRLLSETREFIIVLEEYITRTTEENFTRANKKFGELAEAFTKLKDNK